MNNKKPERVYVSVPGATKEAILALADRLQESESSAALHLLRLGLTAESIAFSGGRIEAILPDGQVRVLADQNGNYLYRLPLPNA